MKTCFRPLGIFETTDIANIWVADLEGCDFEIDIDHATLVTHQDLITAITNSLFSNRLALPDDPLPNPFYIDRMGWWGDPYLSADRRTGQRLGSRLWLLTRSKSSNALLPTAKQYVSESLNWLLQQRVASSFTVDTYFIGNNKEKLGIDIVVYRPNNDPLTLQYRWAWDQVANPGGADIICGCDDGEPIEPPRWHCFILDRLPGYDNGYANAVSADGQYAVGYANHGPSGEFYAGVIWNLNDLTVTEVPDPFPPTNISQVTAVSADASVYVFQGQSTITGFDRAGYFVNGTFAAEILDGTGVLTTGISADGTMITGSADIGAAYWRDGSGPTGLPKLGPTPMFNSAASAVSDDKQVICGVDDLPDADPPTVVAVKWIWDGDAWIEIRLPSLHVSDGFELANVYNISADGSTVVGRSAYDNTQPMYPVYWPDNDTIVQLEPPAELPEDDNGGGIALAISNDLTKIVGLYGDNPRAVVWVNGTPSVLPAPNDIVYDYENGDYWAEAIDISADGTVIIGDIYYGFEDRTERVVWKYF